MRFSIVIPSYNQAAYLPACLDSVLGQQGVELEVLVYDGGSTDGSGEIIGRYARRLAYRQCERDGGQAAALQAGFARATGEVLGWVNSDDILLPGALARMAEFLERNPNAPLAYGDAIWINGEGRVLRPKREIDFDWRIFAYGFNYIPQTAAFFRADAYRQVRGVDAGFRCCMDTDLWHRLCRLGAVQHLPAFLAGIRDHPQTKTNRLKAVFHREHDILRQRYLGCARTTRLLLHVWHRFRRFLLRRSHLCHRPLLSGELAACGLTA